MKRIFVLVFGVLLIAGCIFALSQMRHTTSTVIKHATTTSETLASYANAEFGYRFTYPSGDAGYEVITPPDGPFGDVVFTQSIFSKKEYDSYQLSSTTSETPPSLTIAVFRNPKQLDVDSWIKESSYSNFKLSTNGVLSNVRMGSTTYRSYQWDGLYRGDEYLYAQDGYIYVFSNTWIDAHSVTKNALENVIRSVVWTTPQKLSESAHGDIVLDVPRTNEKVSSPLTLSGSARGTWYFEASFPVLLLDAQGKTIAQGAAHAQGGDWMTQSMVPFSLTLNFIKPQENDLHGTLILKKDNPSGLPERDDAIEVPIQFK